MTGMSEAACRKIVAARSGGSCERCDQYRAESMHHILKRSHGGEWTPSNIAHLCGDGTRGCHGWIEENPIAAGIEGWARKTGEPVRPFRSPLYPGIPCYFEDDGSIRFGEGTIEPRELVTTGRAVPTQLRDVDPFEMAEDMKRARREYIDSHGPARGERP